ncbi:MAG: exodeoxyribonuclease VII small subunit [Planctomycetota bacterium]
MPKSKKTDERPADELPFEQAIEELESLIDRIEAGDTGLDESMKAYERGTKLVSRCRALLDQAEQRVRELTPEQLAAESGAKGPDRAE